MDHCHRPDDAVNHVPCTVDNTMTRQDFVVSGPTRRNLWKFY
jgi:hypothetical protein